MEKPPLPEQPEQNRQEDAPREENLYKLSRERKAFREVLASEETPEAVIAAAKAGLAEIKEKLGSWSMGKEGGLTKAKERFLKDKAKAEKEAIGGFDKKAIIEEMGEKAEIFAAVANLSEKLENLSDFEIEQILKTRMFPVAGDAHQKLLGAARGERQSAESELTLLQKENPTEAKAFELVRDAEGLRKEGHISQTPSVRGNLRKIGQNMLLGKPMFLHGPTGTGKTSLARLAAQRFTGESPEMVYCNPQTRESAVWGKTGIRPAKTGGGAIETVDIYGPLAKAMNEGKVVIFDEFTNLPKEQMSFIKGIFGYKTGDFVPVVGNDKVKMAPGFQMIFTANLKSEKNPERQDLPPEVAREFEQNNLKIDYVPKEEAYDIMLARLMDKDGSITISWRDINETMLKLCEAMEEIQVAYTGSLRPETARTAGVLDASGKTPGLKKLVMTQGTIEAMLESWKAEKTAGSKTTFTEHIDNRLKIGLTFEEYPPADRILAARILASKGFLRTLSPKELNLPPDVFDFDAAKKLRGDKEAIKKLVAESAKEIRIPLKELADLDPFGVRKTGAVEEARRMVEEAAKKRRESGVEGAVSLEKAAEIMKENFLGPEAIEKAFGFTPEEIPPIPFSLEELARAKELNQILILQVDRDGENRPLTMESMSEKVGGKAADGNKLLYDTSWYESEPFFTTESVSADWKLISKEIIPQTINKNYLEQTEIIINHLKTEVFESQPLPQEYEEAIEEFKREKAGIASIIDSDWKTAADKLAQLKITELLRESAADILYRLILEEKQNNQKLLGNIWSWTKARSSDGLFVDVGTFDAYGVIVSGNAPGGRHVNLGFVFSRMK